MIRPLDKFQGLIINWSRPLAIVETGPYGQKSVDCHTNDSFVTIWSLFHILPLKYTRLKADIEKEPNEWSYHFTRMNQFITFVYELVKNSKGSYDSFRCSVASKS